MRFDPEVLASDPERRRTVLAILEAGLEAVDPRRAVERALKREGRILRVGEDRIDLDRVGRVRVVAFGKAAADMARGAHPMVADLRPEGLVVSHRPVDDLPAGYQIVVAGHPVPDEGSRRGALRALEMAESAGGNDLLLCLISGGGSALLEQPAPGLELDDLIRTTQLLLRSGADIGEVNTVRRHLSSVKGGRLGTTAAPARLITLILSDVVGDPPGVIASGPTVPDRTTYRDALTVLEQHRLSERVPDRVLRHLRDRAKGEVPETPAGRADLPAQTLLIVGSGATASQAAGRAAWAAGIPALVVSTGLTGEAREQARACLERAGNGISIWAGETTVTVRGEGRGGRNQEAALAAALALEDDPTRLFAALGTDGIDGPTEAAGGLVDGTTVERGRARGLDAGLHLERNDSSPYLEATGDRLVTGPTGTNVGDLWLVWRTPPQSATLSETSRG